MDSRTRTAFGLLVLSQAVHSIEEYVRRLFDVFPLTRFVSGLFSRDLATGFAIANAGIIAFGLWCYLVPLRSGRPSARAMAWGWVIVELANGVVHVLLAVAKGGYFPGLGTAPLLIASSVYLAFGLASRPMPLTPPAGSA
jgi:hypothetical protein